MELHNDIFQMAWRHIPALIVALIVILRLANKSWQQRSLAMNFNIDATHKSYTKGEN